MAIDPKQITTDLTLELDEEEISAADFSKAFDHFFGLVKEITKNIVPHKDGAAWVVKVYSGSAGFGVNGRRGVYLDSEIAAIRQIFIGGLRQLENGERPVHFSDKAIEHSRALGTLFHAKKAPANVRIWSKQETFYPVAKMLAIKASEFLDAVYEDDGSVDGYLEKLNAHGQFDFVIYDALDRRAIKCEVDENRLQEAWSAFRKRVEVLGKVHYRRDGMPVSVKAKEIIRYPSKDEMPTLDEMRTLLSGG